MDLINKTCEINEEYIKMWNKNKNSKSALKPGWSVVPYEHYLFSIFKFEVVRVGPESS